MVDNVIPYIAGEEDKSDNEPLKIWGSVENGVIVPASRPNITSQCIRVPVTDGHLAAVFMSLDQKLTWTKSADAGLRIKGRRRS